MAAKRLTKGQVIAEIAELSELDKRSVTKVFDGLTELIKKAVPERTGVNPFTKEPQVFKAKPASKKITARPVKSVKDLLQ